jgi:tRNA threonylcarbamoyladenosine biosynthesis protein TsaB
MSKSLLFINGSDVKKIIVELHHNDSIYSVNNVDSLFFPDSIISIIEKILIDHSISLSEIEEINVFTGPGSFTGLRVSQIIAQSLSILLNIPINHQLSGSNVDIKYQISKFDQPL